jgi:hypothetical protein
MGVIKEDYFSGNLRRTHKFKEGDLVEICVGDNPTSTFKISDGARLFVIALIRDEINLSPAYTLSWLKDEKFFGFHYPEETYEKFKMYGSIDVPESFLKKIK